MHFKWCHIPSGNLVNTFRREADALEIVRRTLNQDGHERAEELALGTEDRQGRTMQVALGSELLAPALDEESERARRMPWTNMAEPRSGVVAGGPASGWAPADATRPGERNKSGAANVS